MEDNKKKVKRTTKGETMRANTNNRIKKKPKKKTSKSAINRKKQVAITISVMVGFVAVLLLLYLGAAQYFKTHFYSGSMINGIDATGKTVEGVRAIINEELKEYKIEIKGRDGATATLTGADINLEYVDDNTLEKLKEQQNPYLWFKAWGDKKDYTMGANTTFKKENLKSAIEATDFFNKDKVVAPADAYMKENEDGYEIVPEVVGNTLDEDRVLELLTKAIDQGDSSVDLEKNDCYIKPSIYQDNQDLVQKCEALNKYNSVNITITFGSRSEVVDKAKVKEWLVEGEDGNYSLNEEEIAAYVKHIAYEYDTFGLKHNFTTNAGKKIVIEAGGDYGWAMNRDKTTAKLIEMIQAGGEQEMEPIYRYSAKSREENDIGGTYVEISLQEQRMWCYKDGEVIVDTPIVTGNVSKQFDTPTGIYAIDAKKSPSVLKGEGYVTDVTYWMPFVGNVGIHDADTWRGEYGGEIYKTNGSHGCVNTPTMNAQKIYNTVEIGTAVIVY